MTIILNSSAKIVGAVFLNFPSNFHTRFSCHFDKKQHQKLKSDREWQKFLNVSACHHKHLQKKTTGASKPESLAGGPQ